MLKELKFVQGSIAKKEFLPALTHFKIEKGRVRGYNGMIALSSPIPIDLECIPKAEPLIKAISHCDETVQLSMTKAGKLSIRSGQFKAFIDCMEGETPHIEPTGVRFEFDGEALLKGLTTVAPFISEDASRPWSNGVLVKGPSVYATNNVTLIEYWVGTNFPIECCIPRQAIKEILRINEPPTWGQSDPGSLTLHYADGKWVRTQLLSTEWPNLAKILDAPCVPLPVDEAIFTALEKLRPFVDKIGRVYFDEDRILTHIDSEEGAEVDVPGVYSGSAYSIEMLALLKGVAQTVDWTLYPSPSIFYGERLRGAIVGIHRG